MTFAKYPLPEMLKMRLEEVILQIKILQLGKVKEFLAIVMDPPNLKAIHLSLKLLETRNVLDEHENLTPLGYQLAHLPGTLIRFFLEQVILINAVFEKPI